ncbi:MAG: pyridoxal phosphate-dependent aminotransferase [Bacillota bacterium]|nr:pyridoxal phosphate-dependent aminotransferase [Bacillota bacterium]MDD3299008.1 pyridoxal phosphate-dependent aminotransferase [Bacillota bacterium]MDD3851331.1 pyridoxal phosphate-dependent aminotransferase [Bacillota bacterium]MDD4707566.1 pyridoxal phosphate-dependent aminotransferase [Bacillota bacterium]
MPQISKLAGRLTPSMTIDITAKAKKMKEEGRDIVGFGAGEPDFDTPEFIADAGVKAIREGKTRYTSAYGIDGLRKEISKKLKEDNGLDYSYNQIILSSGAKHSLSTAFQAICDPGDEVIVPLPYWVSYPEMVTIAGGKPVIVKTLKENSFKITARQLEDSITPRTKAIILNSPSNPTGVVYSRKELEKIAAVAVEKDIFVISDEIYEKLVYDGMTHVSIASLGDSIKSLTILINGMSKAYAMTGWRLGYAAAEPDIIKAMGTIQVHAISHPSSIAQYAGEAALKGDQTIITQMAKEYDNRRKYALERLDGISGLTYVKPEGAFYVYISLEGLLGKSYGGKTIDSSLVFTKLLLENKEVAVIPGAAFGDDTYIRMSYATSMEQIKRGLDRMEQFVSEIR